MIADRGCSSYLKTVDSRFLSLDSFRVHYIHGGALGNPLILVHGGGMWLYSFRHNIPSLSSHFSVFALDMPGYGYTLPLRDEQHYGIDATAEVLLQFMNRLGIERASLLGHSWGGGWVLHFAHRHPERVNEIILVDSSGLDVRDVFEWELLKYPIIGNLLLKHITVEAVKKRLRRSFYHQEMVTDDMAQEVYRPLTFRHNRRLQLQLARNQHWSITERGLHDIRQPSLIIWGENDRYLSTGLIQRFEQRLRNARSFVLKKCGHSSHEEYPAEVNALVAAFLKREKP